MTKHGIPEIFNSDQGCQFTSADFTQPLLAAGVRLSMDGRGRCPDNVFVERLWRTVKYEEVYLKTYCSLVDAHAQLDTYFRFSTLGIAGLLKDVAGRGRKTSIPEAKKESSSRRPSDRARNSNSRRSEASELTKPKPFVRSGWRSSDARRDADPRTH